MQLARRSLPGSSASGLGREIEESLSRKEERFWVAVIEIRPCQEISADHLEAVCSRLITTEHSRCSFNGAFDDGKLIFVEFEVDQFPGFCDLPSELSFYGSLKVFSGHRASYVQPGCILELLPVPPGEFGQLHTLACPKKIRTICWLPPSRNPVNGGRTDCCDVSSNRPRDALCPRRTRFVGALQAIF